MPDYQVNIQVNGMTCMGCVSTVKKYLESKGANHVQVDLQSGEVQFAWAHETGGLDKLKSGIAALGYAVEDKNARGKHALDNKTRIAILFTVPLLLIHILGMFLQHLPDWIQSGWMQLVLCAPVFVIGAWHFGRSAFMALRNGVMHMDLLIFIGSTAAFVYSLIGTYTANPDLLFYETSAMIISLVLVGNYIEHRTMRQTRSALDALVSLKPETANRLLPDDTREEVSVSRLAPFDTVIVNTGDAIPADGIVHSGDGYVDESMLTGESRPVYKKAGDEVIGATILKEGSMQVQVRKVGQQSVLQHMIDLVKAAQKEKPSIQRLADQISGIFVPVVIGIALLTWVMSYLVFDVPASNAILNSIAVLVIACPCAMGLATPTAVSAGIGRISRQGVLIKHARILEILAQVKKVLFDKTGTLTTGGFEVTIDHIGAPSEDDLSILYTLENQSSHPIAKSVISKLESLSVKGNGPLVKVREIPGKGVEGYDDAGRRYFVGTPSVAQEKAGKTLVLSRDDQPLLRISLQDTLRPHAKEMIAELRQHRIETVLLSGDTASQVEEVAQTLGIAEFYGEMAPDEKLETVRSKRKGQVVAMVGDGINDAAVLAGADVGISLSSASQIAMNAADLIILQDDLSMIPGAIATSKATLQTIRQNLFWAFSYNIIAIPLAALGFLNPMWGVLFMTFSDIIVIGNSIRLKYRRIK